MKQEASAFVIDCERCSSHARKALRVLSITAREWFAKCATHLWVLQGKAISRTKKKRYSWTSVPFKALFWTEWRQVMCCNREKGYWEKKNKVRLEDGQRIFTRLRSKCLWSSPFCLLNACGQEQLLVGALCTQTHFHHFLWVQMLTQFLIFINASVYKNGG